MVYYRSLAVISLVDSFQEAHQCQTQVLRLRLYALRSATALSSYDTQVLGPTPECYAFSFATLEHFTTPVRLKCYVSGKMRSRILLRSETALKHPPSMWSLSLRPQDLECLDYGIPGSHNGDYCLFHFQNLDAISLSSCADSDFIECLARAFVLGIVTSSVTF
ncbi:hypothetical protein M405DRAFT_373413 [Rhizopogon salebrosus TDB-379]|nr:hypothetical protein M405DRAFT_373413 [Rhizopogon salebrosus TDB-379]